MSLEKEVRAAINRCNAEAESNTPDWILAEYLMLCLQSFNKAVNARNAYYGRVDEPAPLIELKTETDQPT